MKLATLLIAALLVLPAAQPAPAAAPFFFLHFSDPQFGGFTGDKDFPQETANFESAIATANRLRPAFVVITGDLVNKAGDAAQIAEFRRIAAKLSPSIPLHLMPGNHDLPTPPTAEAIAAYVKVFGPDRYVFRHGSFTGVVLNSTLIEGANAPQDLEAAQRAWLRDQLADARRSGARLIAVFQHHPWFLFSVAEPNSILNLPKEKRDLYFPLFHEFGVTSLFLGHYHLNAVAHDGNIELITTGAIGKPREGAVSGMTVVIVHDQAVEHTFYPLGAVPDKILTARVAAAR